MNIEDAVERWATQAEDRARLSAPDEAPAWATLAARIRGDVPIDSPVGISEAELEQAQADNRSLAGAVAFCAESKTTAQGTQPAHSAKAMWERARGALPPVHVGGEA